VMDPIESVDIAADTTFVMMLEAQNRGHEVLYLDPADLRIIDGRTFASVTPVTLQRKQGAHVEFGSSRQIFLDEGVDAALQRKDPPVDANYITATQILSLCRRTVVLNQPQSILAYNEKLLALAFYELMPETVVSCRIADLRDFLDKMGGEMIVKPLDGKGGEGIFHARKGDGNLSSILEQVTHFEERVAMAQRYIPAIRLGDKRILLLDGEPLGAVLRVPAEAEVRANLHVGGRAAKTGLDEDDRRIVEQVGPMLRANGLFFVGIDVIGGLLTEINVTSPTGVQEVNALDDTCVEAEIIDGVEKHVSEQLR
jgi:glutathione synthase